MGKKQIGELTPHELVITILVSQIASIPIEDSDKPLTNALIPILLLISLELIVSGIAMKNLPFRNILQGKPIFVIRNGKLDKKQMKRLRLTMDDLIDALRQKDVFDISEVQDAIIETNGTVSVLLKSEYNTVTLNDMKISKPERGMPIAIVMDGKMITEYFGSEKMTEEEIKKILQQNNKKLETLMLMTIDNNNNAFTIKKEDSE